jgi:phosphoribosyl 1,2-cyclic phosphate phosphodiesterase
MDTRNHRLRTSALLYINGFHFLIDIGPDFRQQMLTHQITDIDAVLLTHPHRDHVGGYDDIRALNFMRRKQIPFYLSQDTYQSLKLQFYYAFDDSLAYENKPMTELNFIQNTPFEVFGVPFTPIRVHHGSEFCFGFRHENFAYITDANHIDDQELEKLKGLDVLVLNALRHTPHHLHFSLNEAVQLSQRLGAKKTYLIHISHQMGLYHDINPSLPDNIHLAYDGLSLNF